MKKRLKKNKLIAEFMFTELGYFYENPISTYESYDSKGEKIKVNLDKCDLRELKYHKSWAWLMPVVEKIESLGSGCHTPIVAIQENNCIINGMFSLEHQKVFNVDGENKIDATYKAVVKFIKWYNKWTN